MDAVEIQQLAKAFDGQAVLHGLDMHVPEGGVYGLVGPARSGKTTLLHLILGFLRRDAGQIRVFGSADIEDMRRQVGYVPQHVTYPAGISIREYLRFLGRCGGMAGQHLERRIDEELEAVGLLSDALRPIERLSKPALQKLGFAQAMLGQPRLLLLDEPTTSSEPDQHYDLLDLLQQLRSNGQTIILATQFLEEIEYLCDYVGILYNGVIATEQAVRPLRGPGRNALITLAGMPTALAAKLRALGSAVTCEGIEIALQPNSPELQAQVLRTILDDGAMVVSVEPFGRPLEDLYRRVVRGDRPGVAVAPLADGEASVAASADRSTQPLVESTPVAARRPGDTLLRDLLTREERHEP